MSSKVTRYLKDRVIPVVRPLANALARNAPALPAIISREISARLSVGDQPPKGFSTWAVLTPHVAAKFMPYAGDSPSYVISKVASDGSGNAETLPVPPKDLWEGYGDTAEEYMHQGRSHTAIMRDILAKSGFPLERCTRILDFGCASGRMLRFLHDLPDECELWGVDINEAHIYWCQQNLGPRFKFANTTTFPHLPFEDGYFDFIYSGSVFTHISELADAWLLELRRITRPGGRLFLSVHDKHLMAELLKTYPDTRLSAILRHFDGDSHVIGSDFAVFTVSRSPYAQVFYDIDYLRERWGRFMKVIAVHEEGYGIQTAVLLEKWGSKAGSASEP